MNVLDSKSNAACIIFWSYFTHSLNYRLLYIVLDRNPMRWVIFTNFCNYRYRNKCVSFTSVKLSHTVCEELLFGDDSVLIFVMVLESSLHFHVVHVRKICWIQVSNKLVLLQGTILIQVCCIKPLLVLF